jgi:2-oxoglutarate ferredoxin oxidoreductase subunit alpha
VDAVREITVGIGGAAGDGQGATAETLGRTCARLGLHAYSYNSYQSLIRGGHIWLRLRLSMDRVENHGDSLTAMIALNQDAMDQHQSEVDPGGVVICNGDRIKPDATAHADGVQTVALPIREIFQPFGRVDNRMQNTVALGALYWMVGLDYEVVPEILAEFFGRKGHSVVDMNVGLFRAGYEYARERHEPIRSAPKWEYSRRRRALITGNEMIGLGAIAGGCKFYSAYPMTPASSILHFLTEYGPRHGMVVRQAEDEISVVNMAIGAGLAGVRAMCATSGGGFALMTEAVGEAAMTETPVVIVNCMRGGPSTGLPTKTEQGDLNQVLGASQGDYPRAIVAPADPLDAYGTIIECLNLAEKYQMPVLAISDLYLSEMHTTIDPSDVRFDVPLERGQWADGNGDGPYRRYLITDTGVSPRTRPGTPGTVHVAATDEHDEDGVLISDVFTNPPMRQQMMEKRMRKIEYALAELPAPTLEGSTDADVTLVGWGSTRGVIREARGLLEQELGITTNQLHIKYIHPFHADEVATLLGGCRRIISVEQNFSGQMARHIRAESGFTIQEHVRRYDGEPMTPRYVADHVKALLAK